MTANYLVKKLNLLPHPEGGFYKETYRCDDTLMVKDTCLERNICTVIYFLLENDNISHFHKIKSDELWFFHEGNALEIITLNETGSKVVSLGKDLEEEESYQAIVPAGVWFGARVKNGDGYALVSCTVAPGFDFKDFELAKRSELLSKYPQSKAIINQMALD